MILRIDSVGGASGDMLLGCLAALGADLDVIAKQVQSALPDHFHLHHEDLLLGGLRGIRATVEVHNHHEPSRAALLATPPPPERRHSHAPAHGDAGHDHDHPHDHDPHGQHDDGHRHGHPHQHAHDHGHAAEDHPPKGHGHGPAHAHSHKDHAHDGAPHSHAHHRNLPEILGLIETAPLPSRARTLAAATFKRLAEAEAAVHGTTVDQIHFHEVGAVDAIVDILGSCLALDQLDVTAVSVGPLPEGQGTLTCDHGVMPIPAPATAELLLGHPVIRVDEPSELVTPTGAALLMTWKAMLPASGPFCAVRNGIGFGQRTLRSRPNLIRGTLAQAAAETSSRPSAAPTEVLLLEANLDDCPGEWIGAALERLLSQGALDAWCTPIQMKKNRPAVLLSVLCDPTRGEELKAILFEETTTFGIRESILRRTVLDRRSETVQTPFGPVRVKIGSQRGTDSVTQPEYEDCRVLAKKHGVAVRAVHTAAMRAYSSSTVSSR